MKRFALPTRPEAMAKPLRAPAKPCKPLQIHLLTAMPITVLLHETGAGFSFSICSGIFRAM